MGAVGAVTALAGAAMTLRKRWGLLVLVAVAAFLGFFPWLLEWFGIARYDYEQAHLWETLMYVLVGLLALRAFSTSPSRPPGA